MSLSVAVCIGTYNQAQFLREAVGSALAQNYPVNEIWVSNDASTDETDAVMRDICARHPHVRYYRQPVNLKLPGNLSWVLSQPKTDLIVRLDSDDKLEPDYVQTLAALMEKFPEAGYAHCDVNEIDESGQVRRVRRLMRTRTFESSEEGLRASVGGYRVAANCILYRAKALRDVDYYRPALAMRTSEDWDMVVRLTAAGWGNVYSPQVLSNYRVWDDGAGVRAAKLRAELWDTAEVYKTRLIPEYMKRGWDIEPVRRKMRERAVSAARRLDLANCSPNDREEYKRVLLHLGDSPALTRAIRLSEKGFTPIFRFMANMRLRMRDSVKRLLRPVLIR